MRREAPPPWRPAARGFTLVELLVALGVMALLAMLSWRGLDGMARAQSQTQTRSDEVLTLQAGLGQWSADLDALVQLPQASAIDWDGRVLRLTRRSTRAPSDGVLVVAWSRRESDGGQWLRWQSPPVTTRGALETAWLMAATWARTPGDEQRRFEVPVAALQDWQIFYFRADAWTHPQSSDTGPGLAALRATAVPGIATIPDGVRLVLTLPPGQALSGRITRDWVRPTLGGGKS
ncbi:MAG: prepilin-type N-terminal cleavage/methylation domain-containing protein [Burkholderiaceae bacterium]|nr:prepilin-type N-terminal cleavage/methylation domain-containing protein [Burkholderiaceae bacterium]MDO9089930.1 prepilin-type N-terminal cleavage/methylation domain-containing protein [Burkholderiaceae bacterium]